MNFKLQYQISKQTELTSVEIIKSIQYQLEEKGYRIRLITDKKVKFDNDPWMPKWNFSPTMFSGGEFEIITENIPKLLNLNYYIDFLYTLIGITIFFIFIILKGLYGGLLFFGAFYLITQGIHVVLCKQKAESLIKEILEVNTPKN